VDDGHLHNVLVPGAGLEESVEREPHNADHAAAAALHIPPVMSADICGACCLFVHPACMRICCPQRSFDHSAALQCTNWLYLCRYYYCPAR
jgi:hypothetical protein